MAPGIAAQIAQCRDGDDEPFRVNLRENGLGDEGAAKIITSVLANPRVTSLDMASNRITSELGEAVKELLTESEVTELDLSENALGNKGVAFISEGIATSQTLRALRIDKCDFDSVGAQSLANALGEASGCGWQLETLGLSSNKIGTATLKRSADMHKTGAQSLMHHLATHDKLQTLDLSWNSFGDEGARLFLEAVNERGPPGSLTSLDLSANNLSEEGATMLAEVFTKCPKLQSLVLNQNMDIGFKGALPFLRLKQEGAIDSVIFGRAASMSSSRPLTALDAERWRTVELRGCGCENLPLPTAPQPAVQDGQEGAIPSEAAETTSTDASFAAPGLGSSEQKQLLACGIPGWGDELPRMWRTSAPAEAREHMDQLYAARRAERKNSTATGAESAPQEITDPDVDLEAEASREEAEAAEAAAAAQRELQEAEEAENAAKEEWQDVERIEARLRSLEAELEELQQGAAEQAAIDGVVATMASLRKQLQVEVAEAEQADAIAQAERREAEAAAAVAAAEQEEAAAAAALAASKRPAKGKGKRRKGKGQLQVVRRPHLRTLPRTLPAHN